MASTWRKSKHRNIVWAGRKRNELRKGRCDVVRSTVKPLKCKPMTLRELQTSRITFTQGS